MSSQVELLLCFDQMPMRYYQLVRLVHHQISHLCSRILMLLCHYLGQWLNKCLVYPSSRLYNQ